MYSFLKRLIRPIIPQKLLFFFEPMIRKLIFLGFYRGNSHTCNICNKTFRRFIKLNNGELLCPNCGSIARSRRLFKIVSEEELKDKRILEFSPSRAMYRRMKKDYNVHYVATDYANEFIADKRLDITNISEENASYDIIICYHVLEHIEQDTLAMKELYRILKPNGKIFIQTPFKAGQIYENPAIKTDEERLKHFGQEDHVRIYSAEGLKNRLESAGFRVEVLEFNDDKANKFGLKEKEIVLVATHSTSKSTFKN